MEEINGRHFYGIFYGRHFSAKLRHFLLSDAWELGQNDGIFLISYYIGIIKIRNRGFTPFNGEFVHAKIYIPFKVFLLKMPSFFDKYLTSGRVS